MSQQMSRNQAPNGVPSSSFLRQKSSITVPVAATATSAAISTNDKSSTLDSATYPFPSTRTFSILGGSSVDVIRNELLRRGWLENRDEWSNAWSLQWSILGRVITHGTLAPWQVVNHFQRAHVITSKFGLCHNIHSARYYDADVKEFFPSCHPLHLHDREDIAEFHLQFRRQACSNIIKRFQHAWRVEQQIGQATRAEDAAERSSTVSSSASISPLPLSTFTPRIMQLCLIGLQEYLRSLTFQIDGLDNDLPIFTSTPPSTSTTSKKKSKNDSVGDDAASHNMIEYANLTDAEWSEIEQLSEQIENDESQRMAARSRANQQVPSSSSSPSPSPSMSPSSNPSLSPSSEFGNHCENGALENDDQEDEQEDEEEIDADKIDQDDTDVVMNQPSTPSLPTDHDSDQLSISVSPLPTDSDISTSHDAAERSVANWTYLNRTPLPLADLYDHFVVLLASLRQHEPQHVSLSHPDAVHNLWIIKPGGLSRGRGIELVNSMAQVMAILKGGGRWVIQRYIERPLVVFRKKFDIRQWVLLTNFNNVLTTWFFVQDCYFRFSSEDYTPYDRDTIIHLTNNSIQKYSEEFDTLQFAKGNMWSSREFIQYLQQNKDQYNDTNQSSSLPSSSSSSSSPSGPSLWSSIQDRMKEIARLTVACGHEGIDLRPNSFTLFGFDYMLSADLRPWLLEVNSSPTLVGIAIPNLVESMVQALIEIVVNDKASTLSETYQERMKNEIERLKQQQQELDEKDDKPVASMQHTRSSSAAKDRPTAKSTSAPKRSQALKSTQSPSIPAPAGSVSLPFLLHDPHPIGHRVGGFEVIESSFIGVIPKTHRQQNSAHAAINTPSTTATSSVSTTSAPSSSSANSSKDEVDKKSKSSHQSSGLSVSGKAITNPNHQTVSKSRKI